MAMINEFANKNAGGVVSIFIGVGTFVGGRLAGRKAKENAFQNGLFNGWCLNSYRRLASELYGWLFFIVNRELPSFPGWRLVGGQTIQQVNLIVQ